MGVRSGPCQTPPGAQTPGPLYLLMVSCRNCSSSGKGEMLRIYRICRGSGAAGHFLGGGRIHRLASMGKSWLPEPTLFSVGSGMDTLPFPVLVLSIHQILIPWGAHSDLSPLKSGAHLPNRTVISLWAGKVASTPTPRARQVSDAQ